MEISILNKINKFPNPTTGDLQINFKKMQDYIKINLIDNTSKNIIVKEYESYKGVSIEINNPSGIYFLKISSKFGIANIYKIIKIY